MKKLVNVHAINEEEQEIEDRIYLRLILDGKRIIAEKHYGYIKRGSQSSQCSPFVISPLKKPTNDLQEVLFDEELPMTAYTNIFDKDIEVDNTFTLEQFGGDDYSGKFTYKIISVAVMLEDLESCINKTINANSDDQESHGYLLQAILNRISALDDKSKLQNTKLITLSKRTYSIKSLVTQLFNKK